MCLDNDVAAIHSENANSEQNSNVETQMLSGKKHMKPTQYTLTSNLTLGNPIMVGVHKLFTRNTLHAITLILFKI